MIFAEGAHVTGLFFNVALQKLIARYQISIMKKQ